MKNSKNSMDNTGPSETTALRPKLDSFDDVLPYVGDFGRYQWWLLLSLLPYSVTYATLYFSQFFLTLAPQEYWCRVDELMSTNLSAEQRLAAVAPPQREYPYYDRCRRRNVNFTDFISSHPGFTDWGSISSEVVNCNKWEYNFTDIPYASISVELDWVCDRAYLVSTAQAIFFCGSIFGCFLFGWIADHKGRIPALILCNSVGLVSSIATASANSFWSFALCRFLTGFAFDNCINIPLIIVLEYMAVRRRSLVVNIAFGLFFGLGSTVLPWVAYYIANWRYFAYISAIPMLSVVLTPWILPESARWYVSNGLTDKVIKKLRRIARINKRSPEPRIYEVYTRNLNASSTLAETATVLDLFRSPRLAKNSLLLICFWFLTVMSFDGHVYSLKLLQSSVFLSSSLAGSTELPAGLFLAILLDRWGRRFCGFITLALTCVFTFGELVMTAASAKLTMSVLCRFCLNMAANVSLQYAAELLPTPVRSQGVSLIHVFGIVAHSMAPYIVDSAKIWAGLPMLVIGIVSFLAALSVLFLPETLGRDLPQTLRQGEEFGKEQRFWNVPCWPREEIVHHNDNNHHHNNHHSYEQ